MTEAEWRASSDPRQMLAYLGDKLSERTLRLFGCACGRRVEHLIRDDRARAALAFGERMADGRAVGRRGRPTVAKAALDVCHELWSHPKALEPAGRLAQLAESNATHAAASAVHISARTAAEDAHSAASLAAAYAACRPPREATNFPPDRHEKMTAEGHQQALLLRDIAGDPFRPAAADPAWLTSTVVAVAAAIYTDRTFHDLPILADALQDAGCDDAAVLEHCRGDGPHVRGCWVVDLVLGKR